MTRKPTQVLEDEHRVIQGMAASLAVVGEEIERGELADSKTLRILSEFLQVFAEKCHRRKEEAHLFTMLEKKGVPAGGCPLAVLSHEHAKLGVLVTQFADSTEMYVATRGEAKTSLIETVHGLLELLPGHIWKEDYLLFPLADKILTSGEQEALLLQFEQVEAELGTGIHQGFERLAKGVEEAVRHPTA